MQVRRSNGGPEYVFRTAISFAEMEPEQREEVQELLEYEEDTAAGRMTTDLIALNETATVEEAVARIFWKRAVCSTYGIKWTAQMPGQPSAAVVAP